MTDEPVTRQGVLYNPSVSLTPNGFKGNKNLTISKMSIFPNYYDKLCSTLPNSCFNPKLNEGIAKELFCLALIVNAHCEGLSDLSDKLQKLLHPELKDETMPVMEQWLDHLISKANDEPTAKIVPECPFEASWIRDRGDNAGFKVWREQNDVTY